MKLTEDQMNLIEDAIELAEKRTSGQIVPAIMDSSDHYPAAHFRLAILVAFLAATLLYYFVPALSLMQMLWGQIAGLIVGYLLAFIPQLKLLLSRAREIDEEVHQRALEVFFTQNMHQTAQRNGILIFISKLERRIELIADSGIHQCVEAKHWDDVVSVMAQGMKNKNYHQAMIDGINSCANELAVHFPPIMTPHNDLPNKLIRG